MAVKGTRRVRHYLAKSTLGGCMETGEGMLIDGVSANSDDVLTYCEIEVRLVPITNNGVPVCIGPFTVNKLVPVV